MTPGSIDIRGSILWKARLLKRLFFHPISLVIEAAVILMLCAIAINSDSPSFAIETILVFGMLLGVVHLFIELKLVKLVPPAHSLDVDVLALPVLERLSGSGTPTSADLLAAAMQSPRGMFIIEQLDLDPVMVLRAFVSSKDFNDPEPYLAGARASAMALSEQRIDANALLCTFFNVHPAMRDILNECDLSSEDFESVIRAEADHHRSYRRIRFFSPEGLLRAFGSFGRSWVMGYTKELNRLTTDISETILWDHKQLTTIHRDKIEYVTKAAQVGDSRNFLLLGKEGVGKRTLIRNIAYAMRRDETDRAVPYTRVLLVQATELLSGVEKPDVFLLHAIKQAQAAGKFILVFEDLPMLMKAANPVLREVLHSILKSKNMTVIGIANFTQYHSEIKPDVSFDMLLQKVQIDDATDDEVMSVLLEEAYAFHKKKIRVTYRATKSIRELCRRYMASQGSPGKELSMLRDAVLTAMQRGSPIVKDEHIRAAVSQKVHMNIEQLTTDDRQKLLQLEKLLQQRIIGQDDALRSVVSVLKRAKLDLRESKRPFGTLLFLGPTGVGKTETAKALAEVYFGSADSMIRVDMNEYGTETSVAELIGSSEPGNGFREGFMMKKIQDRPFSLILLDELEKAHPRILNTLLQILDEGRFIDVRGVAYDFRSSIIIATSNAGNLFMRDELKQGRGTDRTTFKPAVIDHIIAKGIFAPEFVNRFDDIILFMPLRGDDVQTLVKLMLDELSRDFVKRKGITLQFDPAIIPFLAERGYSGEFGAREMRRLITDVVENYLAGYMLEHQLKRGATIMVEAKHLML